MRLKKYNSDQKLRGAYYTPKALAKQMVNWADKPIYDKVLEPSCGDGVFLDCLRELGILPEKSEVVAIEINKEETDTLDETYREFKNVQIINKDFFDVYSSMGQEEKYDLILGNPPYIRYQYLTEKQRQIQAEILSSHGMKPNKLINAWVAFLVASIQLLSETGTIAFVIPAEILQVAYAEELRLFLSTHLSKITLITFEDLVFDSIEQEVLVFIGEKGGGSSGIRIIERKNLDDLSMIDFSQEPFQPLHKVKEKWTKYFVNQNEMNLINEIRNDSRFVRFSSLGIINVGITTGNNKYFSITDEEAQIYDLQNVTLPLIGRSSHSHGIYFTHEDWKRNLKEGKRARLISFPDIPYEQYPEKHKEYIKKGEENKENQGYKCRIRDRWYIVPSVWVPDAFFLRRNNLYPKFVLNKCQAVSTDTMHRIKFNDGINGEDILLSYYNSISFAFTEICGRSYGGGVLEILPGELGNVILPRIHNVDSLAKERMLNFIDRSIRSESNIEIVLDYIDKKLLVESLGLPLQWCKQCRTIWKKLQKRRLGRG